MFYPKNFPKILEKPLIRLLELLEKNYGSLRSTDDLEKRLRIELRDKNLQKLFADKIPSLWWLRFVLLRHENKFSREFVLRIHPLLTKTKTRSLSGIVPLTLFTEGTGCPYNCVYCPNEPGVPKSYFSDEPAVMRAMRHHFDPYEQTLNRLIMFALSNHPIDKVEIIIKGGTFSFYEKKYRKEFVKRIFDACNTDILGLIKTGKTTVSKSDSLDEAQKKNESAMSRIIGINIETRPDFINRDELIFLRMLGVTHVEIGVQIPDDAIYKLIRRGHTVQDVIAATTRLKDVGFKVGYHLMPNLPGSTPEKDTTFMKKIFDAEGFKPDHLKLYPTTLTKHTILDDWYRNGIYVPYSLKKLAEVIIRFKSDAVPPWVRIGRLTRDITTTVMTKQQFAPNLREIIQKEMNKRKLICRCIRCREIRDVSPVKPISIRKIEYKASGGQEYFLEYVDAEKHSLAFLRLRIPPKTGKSFPGLNEAAIVRELHVYGQAIPIGVHNKDKIQHMQYGTKLLKTAEKLATEHGRKRIAVIAGIGTRNYYRIRGFSLEGTYMVKDLS